MSQHILIIEDDTDSQEMVATILQHMNFQVDVVGDGNEASRIIEDSGTQYDLILIDLALPGKDGWQLLEEIRANPSMSSLPCVAVTAFHTSKLRTEAIASGFSAYFPKPIDGTSFGRQITQIINS
ncbi:MAG: response regulator [Chloroflexota bacterium]